MELFMAVCENNSITKTSELLYVSQQGVSKMIRELEDELGCELLHRTTTGVFPTERGQYFFAECRTIIEKKNFICNNISNLQNFPQEIIQVGMAFGMIASLPHYLLHNFEKAYPHVRIEYSDRTDLNLETYLKRGEYDFCITAGIFDSDSINTEKFFDENIFLCIPKTHSLYSKKNITMDDLKDERFAMFSTQFHIRHNFESSCRKHGFEPNIEISSSDFNSLKEIAKSNNLLFTVPEHTINDDDAFLRYHPFPDSEFLWGVYFAKKKGKVLSENMEAFYRYVKQEIESLT